VQQEQIRRLTKVLSIKLMTTQRLHRCCASRDEEEEVLTPVISTAHKMTLESSAAGVTGAAAIRDSIPPPYNAEGSRVDVC